MTTKPRSKEKVQELANFRNAESILLISVKEGDGTQERPMEIAQYVVAKDGSVLGRLERNWMTRSIYKLPTESKKKK